MFKDLGALGSLFKQAREAATRMQGLSEELRRRRVTGSSGGGMVELEVNGLVEVLRCRIDPALVQQNDPEMLEDLVAAAVGDAVRKAKQVHADAVRELTGGLPIPGVDQAIARFLNVGENDEPAPPPPSP